MRVASHGSEAVKAQKGDTTLDNKDPEDQERKPWRQISCPEIKLEISGVPVQALVDTGSEVSCISQELYERYRAVFEKVPTLPVMGQIIKGATGEKSKRIKIQIWVTIQIADIRKNAALLVIPGLVKECIIGYDILHELKLILDAGEEKLTDQIKSQNIKFHTAEINQEKLVISSVICDEEEEDIYDDLDAGGKTNSLEETNKGISYEEIEQKLQECVTMTEEEKSKMTQVIWRYREVFRNQTGYLHGYAHELKLIDKEVIFQRPYPIAMQHRSKVSDEISKMEKMGIIRRSTSPYGNPLVVVVKKDGSIRLCLDARKLNKKLIDDHESPKKMEELYQECNGVRVMSSFDLRNSFWQMPLTEESKKVTAFAFEGRTYEFNVTPFGLKTSGPSLIWGLEKVIKGIPNTLTFVDDILCMARSFDEHLLQVEMLLQRLQQNNLTLNFKKTQFCRTEATFLGFIITPQGVTAQPDKLKFIQEFAIPRNVRELRGFLGVINFYAKFAQNYAKETVPLLKLVKKGIKWKWTSEQQEAFDRIKKIFVEVVTLAHPDPEKPYILTTDASEYALGAVLSQTNDDGQEQVIMFASRTLKGAEIAYFTTEKELLAVVWALQKFVTYLQGAKTIVRTDHQALTFMRTCKFNNSRITRWILAIQDFDLEIQYIPGNQNIVADMLSRQVIQESGRRNGEIMIASVMLNKINPELKRKITNLKKIQDEDKKLSQIKQSLDIFNKKNEARGQEYFKIINELLCRRGNNGYYILIPKSVGTLLAAEVHEMYGHVGAQKVFRIISEQFVCKGLRHIINQTVSVCDSCQRNKYTNRTCAAPMQNIIPERPGDLLSIDFYGPLPTSRGGVKYILVTIDAFSKYVVLYPIKKANAVIVIKKIFEHYTNNYGKQRRIQCDHGTQFTGSRWAKKLKEENVELIFSSIRHPQGNIVERVNRELGRFFRTFVGDKHTNWVNYINIIHKCINETTHETTEFTPLELHCGIKPERMWKKWISSEINDFKQTQEEKIYLARERIKKKGERRSERWNKDRVFTELQIGEEVLVKANNVSDSDQNKISKFFSIYEGPYVVKRKVGDATYLITGEREKERGRFHISNLKKYKRRVQQQELDDHNNKKKKNNVDKGNEVVNASDTI